MAIQVAPVAQSRFFRGVPPQSPYQGRRATISPDIFKGGKPNPAGAGTLASRQIISPDVVGISDEDMQDAVSTETQQVIPNQTTAPTFRLGNEANGRLDLGDILSSRANPNFDPTKAIGGANVPMKPTSGLGGWFRSAFGDKANEQNLAAQQAQGQQWANDAREAKAQAADIAKENRAFDRAKELRGLDSADTDRRDAAAQARQDAEIAANEATRLAERDEDLIREELKAGVAADSLNRTLAATKDARPPVAYDPDKVYQGDDGSLYNFKRDPMTGKVTKAPVTDKPAFTPPPKGSAPDAPSVDPATLGPEVKGIFSEGPVSNVLEQLGQLGGTIPRAARNLSANTFGGRLAKDPIINSDFLRTISPTFEADAGAPATPRRGDMDKEEYKKMLMQLRSMYPTR